MSQPRKTDKKQMTNQLNLNAVKAWIAFAVQDYSGLEQHGGDVYNYFVHNPGEILNLGNPLLIGKVFQVCLGFQEPDEDIQEVRAENAFLCLSQAIKSDKTNVHDEAAARLMILLIRDQKHLIGKVEQACRNEHSSPYDFLGMLDDGLPMDMPMATNTKMLFTAYYLYDKIIDKEIVGREFVNFSERNAYESTKRHIIDNCNQLGKTSQERKMELGRIVFEKICERLRKDVVMYSRSM